MSEFQELVAAMILADAAIIEEACEMALVKGHGVRVVRYLGQVISAAPDPSVPYGHLYEQEA